MYSLVQFTLYSDGLIFTINIQRSQQYKNQL